MAEKVTIIEILRFHLAKHTLSYLFEIVADPERNGRAPVAVSWDAPITRVP